MNTLSRLLNGAPLGFVIDKACQGDDTAIRVHIDVEGFAQAACLRDFGFHAGSDGRIVNHLAGGA